MARPVGGDRRSGAWVDELLSALRHRLQQPLYNREVSQEIPAGNLVSTSSEVHVDIAR